MNYIKDLLVLNIAAFLEQKLVYEISDETKAVLVQPYRFQLDPLKNNIYVWIAAGSPENPDDPDARIGTTGMQDLGLTIPSGEIGGGHLWWRRGKAEVGCYFVRQRYSQIIAANIAQIVYGRTMYWLERAPINGLVDDFGERAYNMYVYSGTFFEGGGPPEQYLWRGYVSWQALTERPY